jgi:hypothetical protein
VIVDPRLFKESRYLPLQGDEDDEEVGFTREDKIKDFC